MAFELPKLQYAYDALEPHIDARTMEIHHTKHHAGYTNNLNNAIAGSALENQSIEDILTNLDMSNMAVRNNGGGFFN
ncbi:MAG TPA: superoxide dismutase, partial [Mangrovimonas sp.]|nr:superoxide dismutase [Mangrovimonas sp.]